MRTISRRRLREFWQASPQQADAEVPLRIWYATASSACWRSPADLKATFGKNVDFVRGRSGSTVCVFNIHGNKYRLIAAIHYDRQRVFVLRVMTHAEYDRNRWKQEL